MPEPPISREEALAAYWLNEAAGDMLTALREIVEECNNPGYPNEIVADRMIERIEETALEAIAKAEARHDR